MCKKPVAAMGLAVGIAIASSADAAVTKYLRQGETGGGTIAFNGNTTTAAAFDDAVITTGTSSSSFTTPNGTNSNVSIRTTSFTDQALLAIKDLFALVPASSGGGDIDIISAKLHLFANSAQPGDANATLAVRRVTSDWLLDTAGSNEDDVSGRYRRNSTTTNWAAGAGGFGTSDYDAAAASITWTNTANAINTIDVTALVEAMYTAGANYGFRISTSSVGLLSFRSSDHFQTASVSYKPVLEITYDYLPVPEPASVALLVTGVFVAGRRRG